MSKILLEDIQKEASNIEWELLSTEYKNLKTPLNWVCPNGHKVILTYEKWRRSHQCPSCELEERDKQKELEILPKNAKDYRILALDQATKISGYAIFQNGELIAHGIHESSGKEVERINDVKNWLWNLITIYKIDYVQLEDIQLQEHGKDSQGNEIGVTTYKALARLQGVLENLLYSNNIEYSIVFPATWRKSLEIKGKSKADKKKNAQLKVKSAYNIDATLDEAEAICIGKYAVLNHTKSTQLISWE